MPISDMECSWVPDLWLKPCCIEHDLGAGDIEFLMCILIYTILLAIVFSVLYWCGMLIGRPIRNYILRRRNKE